MENIKDFITNSNKNLKFIEEHETETIKRIRICRKPVEEILLKIIKTINNNFNEYIKAKGYDYLCHLWMIIETEEGNYYKTEKSPRIVWKKLESLDDDYKDYFDIQIYKLGDISIKEMLDNTEEIMGKKYDEYNYINNNCQVYIYELNRAIFKKFKLEVPDAIKRYIYTPIDNVIKKNGLTSKLVNATTDIGRRVNSLIGKNMSDIYNIDYPLSDEDIKKYFDDKCKILKYNEIDNFKIKENEPLFILYELKSNNNGHWICINKFNNEIYYFDSYGSYPENELKHQSQNAIINNLNPKNKVLKWLLEQPEKINYNNYEYQKEGNTCGKWCCVFSKLKLNIDNFNKLIKYNKPKEMSNDEYINILFEKLH